MVKKSIFSKIFHFSGSTKFMPEMSLGTDIYAKNDTYTIVPATKKILRAVLWVVSEFSPGVRARAHDEKFYFSSLPFGVPTGN